MKKRILKLIFNLWFGVPTKTVDELEFIERYLKRKGYDKNGTIYTKGFVVIELKLKGKEIDCIEVFTDQVSRQKQTIDTNFSTGVIIAEKYFSRI